jgi:hypothetical protein
MEKKLRLGGAAAPPPRASGRGGAASSDVGKQRTGRSLQRKGRSTAVGGGRGPRWGAACGAAAALLGARGGATTALDGRCVWGGGGAASRHGGGAAGCVRRSAASLDLEDALCLREEEIGWGPPLRDARWKVRDAEDPSSELRKAFSLGIIGSSLFSQAPIVLC